MTSHLFCTVEASDTDSIETVKLPPKYKEEEPEWDPPTDMESMPDDDKLTEVWNLNFSFWRENRIFSINQIFS